MLSKLTIPDCISEANPNTSVLTYKNQTPIYRQGEIVSSVWIIRHGFVKIHRLSVQGKQVTLSLLGKNAILGAVEPQQTAVSETASTQSSGQLIQIARTHFDLLLANNADFSQFVAKSLFWRKEALQNRLFCIMHRKVESRIAALLTDLARHEGEKCIHGGEIDVRLSQQDIADMIAASRQVVSSVLNRLRERDIVHYSRNLICIINLPALMSLVEN